MRRPGIPLKKYAVVGISLLVMSAGGFSIQTAHAGNGQGLSADKARITKHWTKERRANAIPRDLVIDSRGLGYLRKLDGSLQPYGHQVAAEAGVGSLKGKPSGDGDTTPPAITNMDPGEGAEIGPSYTFSADVTDASGIKSVTFVVEYPDGTTTRSLSPSRIDEDTWSIDLTFSSGSQFTNWRWWVIAKDGSAKGGLSATSEAVNFVLNMGGSEPPPPDPGSDTVTNAVWEGGAVQNAAGRIYFEMLNNTRNKRRQTWVGYVCSGTVVVDGTSNRSVILTAAHCVYDDVNKMFARNVLFIPNQAGTEGSGTDLNCGNDPLGCWTPSFGVVDEGWTAQTFPDNIPVDYAFYVVDDSGAHESGINPSSDALDVAAGALPISFLNPNADDGVPGADSADFTHALGYSWSVDPEFRYCAEDMTTEGADNWWLPSCEMSGGSSGGPWVQPMDIATGSGPVISVNSWGYSNSPGMAGPRLNGTSAACLLTVATTEPFESFDGATDGEEGIAQSCP